VAGWLHGVTAMAAEAAGGNWPRPYDHGRPAGLGVPGVGVSDCRDGCWARSLVLSGSCRLQADPARGRPIPEGGW